MAQGVTGAESVLGSRMTCPSRAGGEWHCRGPVSTGEAPCAGDRPGLPIRRGQDSGGRRWSASTGDGDPVQGGEGRASPWASSHPAGHHPSRTVLSARPAPPSLETQTPAPVSSVHLSPKTPSGQADVTLSQVPIAPQPPPGRLQTCWKGKLSFPSCPNLPCPPGAVTHEGALWPHWIESSAVTEAQISRRPVMAPHDTFLQKSGYLVYLERKEVWVFSLLRTPSELFQSGAIVFEILKSK